MSILQYLFVSGTFSTRFFSWVFRFSESIGKNLKKSLRLVILITHFFRISASSTSRVLATTKVKKEKVLAVRLSTHSTKRYTPTIGTFNGNRGTCEICWTRLDGNWCVCGRGYLHFLSVRLVLPVISVFYIILGTPSRTPEDNLL